MGQASKGAQREESGRNPKGKKKQAAAAWGLPTIVHLEVLLSGLSLGTILRKAISFTSSAEDFCRSVAGHFE